MDDLANGLISFCILLPWLPLLKNEVVMYTWPAHTARTKNILRTFIQVWELAVSSVTNWKIKKDKRVKSLRRRGDILTKNVATYGWSGPSRSRLVWRWTWRSRPVCTVMPQSAHQHRRSSLPWPSSRMFAPADWWWSWLSSIYGRAWPSKPGYRPSFTL